MRPANNLSQKMVCSCEIPSKWVFAANSILLMRNCKHALVRKMADRFPELTESDLNMKKLGDGMMNQLLNAPIVKYCDLIVSVSVADQLFDSLATDKYDILINQRSNNI